MKPTQLYLEKQVNTNTSAIGNNNNLSTSNKTDLVSALNEILSMPVSNLSRQALINGNFDVWQRGTSFSTSPTYTADRWILFHNHTSVTVSQQSSFLPVGSKNNIRLLNTTRGSGTFFEIVQAIETSNCIGLINKKVTLSFYARKNALLTSGNLQAAIKYTVTSDDSSLNIANGLDVGSLTIINTNLSTSFQKYTLTGSVPSTARTIGIQFNMTALPSDGGYIDIAQVQLCEGEIALPFQQKSYAEELRDCMRYCEVMALGPKDYTIPIAEITSTTTASINYEYKVIKRTIPTLVVNGSLSSCRIIFYSAPNGSTVASQNGVSALSLFLNGTDIYRGVITLTPTSSFSGTFYYPTFDTLSGTISIWFDAEL